MPAERKENWKKQRNEVKSRGPGPGLAGTILLSRDDHPKPDFSWTDLQDNPQHYILSLMDAARRDRQGVTKKGKASKTIEERLKGIFGGG